MAPREARFVVERLTDGWQVVDNAYATVIGTDTKREATEAARFARQYVKRHGDIDFGSFPWSLEHSLRYDNETDIDQWWEERMRAIPLKERKRYWWNLVKRAYVGIDDAGEPIFEWLYVTTLTASTRAQARNGFRKIMSGLAFGGRAPNAYVELLDRR